MQHELDDIAAALSGHLDTEVTAGGIAPLRLPAWTRSRHADGGIDRMSAQTSGVRMRVLTAARELRLHATFTRTASAAHPPRPITIVASTAAGAHRVDLDEGDILLEDRDRSAVREAGAASQVRLVLDDPAGDRLVTIHLPHAAATLIHRLEADAPLRPAPAEGRRWIHYGSSISHGSDLDDPRGPWPHQVGARLDLDLVNMGFAGNAMLDGFVARAIAATRADLISVKVGINLVNGDAMRARTFVPALHEFLDLIREGHPDVPVALITALACSAHEDATGPTRPGPDGRAAATPRPVAVGDGSLTLRRTRSLVAEVAAARQDPALHLVDGLALLGVDDGHLPDGLHPDQGGHDLIAARIAPIVAGLLER